MILMAQSAQALNKTTIDNLYDNLAKALMKGLKRGYLFVDDARQSADYILSHLEKIRTYEELFIFLQELAKKWDAYQEVFLEFKRKDLIKKAQQELKKLN